MGTSSMMMITQLPEKEWGEIYLARNIHFTKGKDGTLVEGTAYVYLLRAGTYTGLEPDGRWTHRHCRPHSYLP